MGERLLQRDDSKGNPFLLLRKAIGIKYFRRLVIGSTLFLHLRELTRLQKVEEKTLETLYLNLYLSLEIAVRSK